jgi:Domain of unknown function (DUF4259)
MNPLYNRADMGAWDYGTLDNDDAQDFIGDLLDTRGDRWRMVEAAIDLIADAADTTESNEEGAALAACEVVAAAANGAASEELDEEVAAWAMRTAPKHLHMLAQRAIGVVNRIAERSELKTLWEQSSDFQLWDTELQELRRRLTVTIH